MVVTLVNTMCVMHRRRSRHHVNRSIARHRTMLVQRPEHHRRSDCHALHEDDEHQPAQQQARKLSLR